MPFLDTSVVIDLELLDASDLPGEVSVTSITMAELAAGPHATGDHAKRARRLQRAEAAFGPIPFDAAAARAYGRIYAAVDLLIAADAAAAELPLCTRNADDFAGLDDLVDVVAL